MDGGIRQVQMSDTFKSEWLRCVRELENGKELAGARTRFRKLAASRPVIVYGAHIMGGDIVRFLRNTGIHAACYCDTYKTGFDERAGLRIIGPEELKAEYAHAVVVIGSIAYLGEIFAKLMDLGFEQEQIFDYNSIFANQIPPEEFRAKHYAGYEWAYGFFQDDVSKDYVVRRMRYYLIGDAPSPCSPCPQYFEDGVLSVGKDEIVVDAGAHGGNTANEFSRRMAGGRIYCFEPDDVSYGRLARNTQEAGNIQTIKKGLYHSEAEVGFLSGGTGGSRIDSAVCGHTIPVTSVDRFFAGKSAPTIIIADIEGGEKDMLLGAQKCIADNHPQLAICAYHKAEDIYELPEIILRYHDGYKLFLRHYSRTIRAETVLYAVN
jgi:FkbM family methyltransferase